MAGPFNSGTRPATLVTPEWLAGHRCDPNVVAIEVAGLGQDDLPAYRAGHVPGAYAWRWKETLWDGITRGFPDPDEFARRMGAAGIGNDTIVVFYGEGQQFGVYAWWVFTLCGHRDVRILDGGRTSWPAEGRLLETAFPAPAGPVRCEPVPPREGMRIYRDEVLAAVENGDHVILDGRSPEEYRGERVGGPGGPDVGAMRAGHIPGARHLHYEDLFDEAGRFRPAWEIRDIAAAHGVTADTPVITYCRLSHRATVLQFALAEILGHDNVRVYDGSWTEWGNLVGVPIEC